MQIHELNEFVGTPANDDYLAIDDGTETTKVSAGALEALSAVLVLNIASFSSLPKTVTNANITSAMEVIKAELGTPSAQTADWTVTTSNGSLTISGTSAISGSTTLKLYLAKCR